MRLTVYPRNNPNETLDFCSFKIRYSSSHRIFFFYKTDKITEESVSGYALADGDYWELEK